MVGPSKILTVSYGTFSCTLEGFDDPFSTMRGIAEYFRDLAADDRYFGAEPPTPDAEMLHKIAEREVKRRVETRVEDGGIILRQAQTEPVMEAPAASQPTVTEPVTPLPTPAPQTRPRTESVAEKLARLRAAMPENEGLAPEANASTLDEDGAASLAAAFDEYDDEAPQPETPSLDVTSDAMDVALDTSDDAMDQPEPATADWVQEEEPAVAAADDAQADSDDLVDLSDVDLDAEEASEPEAPKVDLSALEFEEDDAENQPDEDDSIDLDSLLSDAPSDLAASDTEEAPEVDVDVSQTDETDDTADEFAALIAAEAQAAREEEENAAAELAQQEEQTVARVLKMRRADFEAAIEAQQSEDATQPETIIIDPVAAEEFAPEFEEDDVPSEAQGFTDDDDALADDLANALGDLSGLDDVDDVDDADEAIELSAKSETAMVETDTLEGADETPEEPEMAVTTHEPQDDPSSLSSDDEAELLASLSILENEEFEEDEDDDDDADFSNVPIAEPRVASTSVERLFEVTNSELAGRESSRRRSAIAHLKAAVAATRADRDFAEAAPNDADKTDEDFDITAYREDLARVVRPKRPAEKPNSAPRRLPPLMLVSEQRVDDHVEQAVAAVTEDAVRPRRVASDEGADLAEDTEDDNIFAEAGSFAEFAEEVGARELPDMLEAAAAYYSYVEGQPHFSRPQIMKAVAAINTDGNFSREDGLRSFGQLLRHGKIRKIRRGQFEIDQSTRFKPAPLQLGA